MRASGRSDAGRGPSGPARRSLAALVLGLAVAACSPSDQDRLQGSWRAVAAERAGQPAPELVGEVLVFDGERFRILRDGRERAGGSFTVHPLERPAWIELRVIEGGTLRGVRLGVYRFTAEGLELADNGAEPGRPRPADFTPAPGRLVVRYVRA
jgi:uncharacterized protein (TIGR03067 family)